MGCQITKIRSWGKSKIVFLGKCDKLVLTECSSATFLLSKSKQTMPGVFLFISHPKVSLLRRELRWGIGNACTWPAQRGAGLGEAPRGPPPQLPPPSPQLVAWCRCPLRPTSLGRRGGGQLTAAVAVSLPPPSPQLVAWCRCPLRAALPTGGNHPTSLGRRGGGQVRSSGVPRRYCAVCCFRWILRRDLHAL